MTKAHDDASRLAKHESSRPDPESRLHGDRGEGVISAAIAVLIMAFLGALMWVGFRRIWEGAERNTETKVQQIGSD
jgi:hypothetical protein